MITITVEEVKMNGMVGYGVDIQGCEYDMAKALAESIRQTLVHGYKYPSANPYKNCDEEDCWDYDDDYDDDEEENSVIEEYTSMTGYLMDIYGEDVAETYSQYRKAYDILSLLDAEDSVIDEVTSYLESEGLSAEETDYIIGYEW